MGWPCLPEIGRSLGTPLFGATDPKRASDLLGNGMHFQSSGIFQLIALSCFGPFKWHDVKNSSQNHGSYYMNHFVHLTSFTKRGVSTPGTKTVKTAGLDWCFPYRWLRLSCTVHRQQSHMKSLSELNILNPYLKERGSTICILVLRSLSLKHRLEGIQVVALFTERLIVFI
jgi:hypothetical protein